MKPSEDLPRTTDSPTTDSVRNALAIRETVLAARQRPMSERLELALSWNAVAAELRAGLAAVTGQPDTSR